MLACAPAQAVSSTIFNDTENLIDQRHIDVTNTLIAKYRDFGPQLAENDQTEGKEEEKVVGEIISSSTYRAYETLVLAAARAFALDRAALAPVG